MTCKGKLLNRTIAPYLAMVILYLVLRKRINRYWRLGGGQSSQASTAALVYFNTCMLFTTRGANKGPVVFRRKKRNHVPVHPTPHRPNQKSYLATIRASRARLGPAADVAGSNAPPPPLNGVWTIVPLDEIPTRRGVSG
jgi:hypothetical protein